MRLGLLAALVIAIVGCATETPSSSAPGPAPVAVSEAREGVVVTVSASTGTLLAGDKVAIRVEITNVGIGPVTWQSGGCELLNGFGIDGPEIVQPPAGREWPAVAGLAKWSATTGGVAIEGIRSPNVPDGVAFGCPADLRYDEIDPGETISAEAVWWSRTTDGVPGPAGAYRITYAFPLIGRLPARALPLDPVAHPIALALPIVVEGEPFTGIASTQAVDAALADARVATWIDERLPLERLGGAEIRLVDGRWRFIIQVENGSTVVLIDPATGRVTDVRLAAG